MAIQPLISIVVPIYKAEAYLQRCVDSILRQTLHEIEIILVDDGSPDNSGLICDRYAATDNRIKVIHQENGGLRAARAAGIAIATGEYIAQIDPDDWVDETMLEEQLACAQKGNADIVICDLTRNDTRGETYVAQPPSALNQDAILDDLITDKLSGYLWNKLIRRNLFSPESFLPYSVTMMEDTVTCVHILTHHQVKVAYLPKAFYHYDCCINPNSISVRNTPERNRAQKLAISILETLLTDEKRPLLYHSKNDCLANMLRLGMQDDLQGSYSEIAPQLLRHALSCRKGSLHALLLYIGIRLSWKCAYAILWAIQKGKEFLALPCRCIRPLCRRSTNAAV